MSPAMPDHASEKRDCPITFGNLGEAFQKAGAVYIEKGKYALDCDAFCNLIDALNETVRRTPSAAEARMREALESPLLLEATAHYAHHDPQGTAGANCPACIAGRQWREIARAALRPEEQA